MRKVTANLVLSVGSYAGNGGSNTMALETERKVRERLSLTNALSHHRYVLLHLKRIFLMEYSVSPASESDFDLIETPITICRWDSWAFGLVRPVAPPLSKQSQIWTIVELTLSSVHGDINNLSYPLLSGTRTILDVLHKVRLNLFVTENVKNMVANNLAPYAPTAQTTCLTAPNTWSIDDSISRPFYTFLSMIPYQSMSKKRE